MLEIDPSTLANICTVAAARFDENADIMRRLINTVPTGDFDITPRGNAARMLGLQFKKQAEEAREYAELFNNHEVTIHEST